MVRPERKLDGRPRPVLIVLTILLLALASAGAVLLERYQDEQQQVLTEAVDGRRVTAAQFVTSYVGEVLGREQELAARAFSQPVGPEAFTATSKDHGFAAAVLLDDQGEVLASEPYNAAVIGKDVRSTYAHLNSAASGTPAVSGVVPSVARREPVIGFAVPFETPQGRRVFSGAYPVDDTPLAPFVRSASRYRTWPTRRSTS